MNFNSTTTRRWFESGDNVHLVANILTTVLYNFTTPESVLDYFEKPWHWDAEAEIILAADDPFDLDYYEALEDIYRAADEVDETYNGNLVEPNWSEALKELS